jgi:hypothetical protein
MALTVSGSAAAKSLLWGRDLHPFDPVENDGFDAVVAT